MTNHSITFTFMEIPVCVEYRIFNGDEIDIGGVEVVTDAGRSTGVTLDELLSNYGLMAMQFEQQLVTEIKKQEGEL